jgi:hypothetical protein
MDFARVDGKIDAFEDLLALNAGVEVSDFKYRLVHFRIVRFQIHSAKSLTLACP